MSDKDKLEAAINFIRHTGAQQIQIRYSDDEQPTIWFVVAKYGKKDFFFGSDVIFETDSSAVSPLRAALRLCERLADGGKCIHCGRTCGFEPDRLERMPYDEVICWYQYDPELKVFRRGCE